MTSKEKLEALRASLAIKDEKSKGGGAKTPKADVLYKHWDIPVNSEASIRFLPDADPTNDFFWQTKLTINLPFNGQVGGDYPTENPVTVTVPCIEQFGPGRVCPIISATRPWWKQGPEKEALARQYYKKKSYIFQGFVVKSPFEEALVPENPIRRFAISSSIYEIIYKGIMNPEFEDMPNDFVGGRDFKIAKTTKGEFASYATSSWAFRTRPLSENELIAVDQFGLFNLREQLGTEPDADGVEMIKQMFLDSVAGKPFDFDSYGEVYRAYGQRNEEGAVDNTVRTTSLPARVAQATTASVSEASEEATPVTTKPAAADILARIRERTGGR
jgi:hypothetical protein